MDEYYFLQPQYEIQYENEIVQTSVSESELVISQDVSESEIFMGMILKQNGLKHRNIL